MNNPNTANVDLNKILANAQLPALPQSAIQLLELSKDPENGPAEFAIPIESDPGLAGQVLKFVNSSYFGFSREISSVKLAITLVGIRTIKNFALWSAVFSLMPNPKCGPFDLKSLWQDSLRRALFARAVGKCLGMQDTEDVFSAALLQDMAIPLLAKEAPAAYRKLLDTRDGRRVRLSELEHRVFGWTHADAAGIVLRHWNLPEQFAVLVESHNGIRQWAERPKEEPGRFAVALSALLPSTRDAVWYEYEEFGKFYANVASAGGPKMVELLARIDQEFTEFAPVLKIGAPSRTLVDACGDAVPVAS